MAKSTIGSLLIDLQLSTSTLDKQLKGVNKKFDGLGKNIKKIGGALAAAFAVTSFTSMIDNTLKLNDALGKTADRLGIAVEDLQGLHFAAEQSGVSIPTLEMALQRMTRRVSEAGMGTGEAVKALKELGIEASALSKMTVSDQLDVLADALSGVESESDKVRIAMKLFDSEGVKLLNMLKDGAEGLQAYKDEADSLGFVLDRQMIAKMEAANDSMNKVDRASQGLKNVFAVALAPAITTVANSFIDFATQGEGAQGMLKNLHGGIRSVLKAIDILSESLRLSLQGWVLIGNSIDLVAETFFGSAEGVKRAEDAILSLSRVANNQFAKSVEVFYEGGSLAKGFDINLEELSVTAERTGVALNKLADTTKKSTKATKAKAKAIKEVKVELTEYQKFVMDTEDKLASGMTNMFRDWQQGALDFKETMRNVLNDIAAQLFQTFVANKAISMLGGLFSAGGGGGAAAMSLFAKGGAFSNGVQAFASGGVVNSPTIFPMANGMGLMGEQGPESIMPLTRTSNGDLGITAKTSPINIIINNYGNDNVEVQQNGNDMEIIISQIASSIQRGTGDVGSAIESRYGLVKK